MIRRFGLHLITSLIVGLLGASAPAGEKASPATKTDSKRRADAKLLEGVKAPPGFQVTMFASPPDIRYPACLTAAPTGELFVGIDENGSLDAKADRGRVVRCLDDDGDGQADRFNVFARMDSPRGLIYDASTRTLYVLHPPKLTAYHDDDGDGTAERSVDLVDGIGFDLKFRGADHTTNGIRLGIDGWIYVAVGDYGFVKAVGKDGVAVQLHGGGVARVRTDGTGLELFSRGQRNIYDVAIDPLMNVFTRDNTNDGGGWDVRLSQVIQTGQYGYPSLFTRFPDEIVPPLADYGGGSPTGSLYLQEPGLPPGFGDTLYTCEWGRSVVDRHPLEPRGAGFKAGKESFVELPRPTDMDVDGRSRIYVASWREGGFTFDKPDVGYVIRVTYPGTATPEFPDLKTSSVEQLVADLASPSEVLRLNAQRQILKRGDRPAFAPGLEGLARADGPLPPRVAAIFTLGQLLGGRDQDTLIRLAEIEPIREFVLRALADRPDNAERVPAAPFLAALSDANPRVRLQAVIGLARLGHREAASALLARTADGDALVAHAAVNALVSLHAVDACLEALDPESPRLIPGAVRVLQSLHQSQTVDGLIQAFDKAHDETTRRACLKALCRLYHREADWDGKWWGTRPDTSGPYFKAATWSESDRIGRTLTETLTKADAGTARWLLTELIKNKVDLAGSTAMAIKLAGEDATLLAATVESLAGQPVLDDPAVQFLGRVAASDRDAALRAKALRGLERHLGQPSALDAAVTGFATIAALDQPDTALNAVLQDFLRGGRHARNIKSFVTLADDADPARRALAFAVLLEIDRNPRSSAAAKAAARTAVDKAWSKPQAAASLLRAIGRARVGTYALQVRNRLKDPNPEVRDAAVNAARRLDLDHTARHGGSQAPTIASLSFEQVTAGLQKEKGDRALGAELFQKQGCLSCHTVSADEPPKGPFLGGIGTRYSRAELTESILKPNAKIAQGFETQKFATVSGLLHEGFVVREAGDEVELRNAAGEVTVLAKKDIEERGKVETSVMPTGLADPLTVADLASLLTYLESLKAK
jgi:putative membrane-bound dehydrogenase-like protein